MASTQLSRPHRAVVASRSEKVSRTVARLIVKDIAERGLMPGSPLPPEVEMARHYSVGRTTIREALRLLEAQGLVTIRQGLGGGPSVGQPDGSDFGETLTMYLHVQQTRFEEIIEAAAEFDGMIAGVVAGRVASGTLTDLAPLVAATERRLTGQTFDEIVEEAGDFHDVMRSLAGNYVLEVCNAAVSHIFTERTLGVHQYEWTAEHRTMLSKQHGAICEAIRKGNADRARKLAVSHLLDVGHLLTKHYPGLVDEIVDWR